MSSPTGPAPAPPETNSAAQVAVFLKQPWPGHVKTRLASSIGASAAAALYRAFACDTLGTVLELGAAGVRLVHDGPAPRRWLPAGLSHRLEGCAQRPQPDGNLGARLAHAFGEAAREGIGPLLVLGSDSPDLPRGHIERALAALGHADLVLGAVPDGGVWCIGLRRDVPGFFDGIPWSSPGTGEALRNRGEQLGLKLVEPPAWFDVDVAADLRALRERLAPAPAAAPWTARWLAQHPPLPANPVPQPR